MKSGCQIDNAYIVFAVLALEVWVWADSLTMWFSGWQNLFLYIGISWLRRLTYTVLDLTLSYHKEKEETQLDLFKFLLESYCHFKHNPSEKWLHADLHFTARKDSREEERRSLLWSSKWGVPHQLCSDTETLPEVVLAKTRDG